MLKAALLDLHCCIAAKPHNKRHLEVRQACVDGESALCRISTTTQNHKPSHLEICQACGARLRWHCRQCCVYGAHALAGQLLLVAEVDEVDLVLGLNGAHALNKAAVPAMVKNNTLYSVHCVVQVVNASVGIVLKDHSRAGQVEKDDL
jgi:hypothetical protein